jgi:hypothetical protein
MYRQGGSFNPHYRTGAPPLQSVVSVSFPQQLQPPPLSQQPQPPQQQQQAGVTGPFPQQPQQPPPPQQQQQAGVTTPFPQQPVPLPLASYPQHPGVQPPPGAYPHNTPHFQNPAYPFSQHGQMHQGPMGPHHRSFPPMPISGPLPPQAMYQGPQYTMPGPLPPPPPRPPSFTAPPPPPPPSSPPPLAPAPPTFVVAQSWNAEVEGKQGVCDGADGAKTEKAEVQLIVSDDSDMDMDG